MSYLALARKWRPRTFAELVGQEHVVKALRNALDTGRVHHAFLFTGTRGVGKTTIARIFAKSLNCETGVSSQPCGVCQVCRDVDAGRFVDLVEIDAASRTKVDDTRELLEDVIYAPSRGRYKVFLIDEVHMLSNSSFNALLKTLEEPPEHVKFLLATTDPQKLPVTVLSRCLQFNLRRLRGEEIAGQMQHILAAEGIESEPAALALVAHAADGSMRDGLSLLDQAIAHGGGRLNDGEVRAMLGTLDQDAVLRLLEALAAGDGPALYAAIESLAAFVVDYGDVLADVAKALHRIQLRQVLPDAGAGDDGLDPARLAALAQAIAPEDVQLYYQIATQGTREIPLAPTPRIGLEMSMLRMLAFRPDGPAGPGQRATSPRTAAGNTDAAPEASAPTGLGAKAPTPTSQHREPITPAPSASQPPPRVGNSYPPRAQATGNHVAEAAQASSDPSPARSPDARGSNVPETPSAVPLASALPAATTPPVSGDTVQPVAQPAFELPRDTDSWIATLDRLGVRAAARMLADNCVVIGDCDGVFVLALRRQHELLLTDMLRRQIEQSLSTACGKPVRLRIDLIDSDAPPPSGSGNAETPAQQADRMRQQRQAQAEQGFMDDPQVGVALRMFDAQVVPGSVRPV